MRISKASPDQKASYKGITPLYGFARIDGQRCIVEYLGEGRDNPNYEVLAPDGFRFTPEGTTTLIGFTLSDLIERIEMNSLESYDE